MTINIDAKTWQRNPSQVSGGRFYSDVDKVPASGTITFTGSGFGSGPTVALFRKWTDGVAGTDAPLEAGAGEVGDFDEYHYGMPSKFFEMAGTTGIGIAQGGTTAATNQLTRFLVNIGNFSEFTVAYDTGVPAGRHFSGASAPETFNPGSNLKNVWLFDGPPDNASLADIVLPTAVLGALSIQGNNSADTLWGPTLTNTIWAWDDWNGQLVHQKPGADPFNDNGFTEWVQSWKTGTTTTTRSTHPTFDNATNAQYNRVAIPGWIGNNNQDMTQHLYRYFYLAVGANSRARIELGNASTYAACTKRRVLRPTAWSDTEVVAEADATQLSGMTHKFITTASGTQFVEAL